MRNKEKYKKNYYDNKNIKINDGLIDKNEKYNRENESDVNEYFNLQIKLPNGKIQSLKIYENDDANKVVEEFCKINYIDYNIKKKLIKNIEKCQKEFLNKEKDNNEEREDEE